APPEPQGRTASVIAHRRGRGGRLVGSPPGRQCVERKRCRRDRARSLRPGHARDRCRGTWRLRLARQRRRRADRARLRKSLMPGRVVFKRADLLIPLLERKRMLDSAWIVSLVAGLGSVWLLWFTSILQINLERAAWVVLAYVTAYLIVASLGDRLSSPFAVTQAIRLTTLTSILFLGLLWHLVGGLDNPMFLPLFPLPLL